MHTCARCGTPLESPTGCAACHTLFDVAESATPFELFGFDATSYALDARELRKRSLRASRVAHPDFFGAAGDEQRALAERTSARLNKAFEILSDDVRRADWIVAHRGGPREEDERSMPQEFLLEVLEWNELLEESRSSTTQDARVTTLARELSERRAAALERVARLLTPLPAHGSPQLRQVRQELNAVRYVDRALAEIEAQRLAR